MIKNLILLTLLLSSEIQAGSEIESVQYKLTACNPYLSGGGLFLENAVIKLSKQCKSNYFAYKTISRDHNCVFAGKSLGAYWEIRLTCLSSPK